MLVKHVNKQLRIKHDLPHIDSVTLYHALGLTTFSDAWTAYISGLKQLISDTHLWLYSSMILDYLDVDCMPKSGVGQANSDCEATDQYLLRYALHKHIRVKLIDDTEQAILDKVYMQATDETLYNAIDDEYIRRYPGYDIAKLVEAAHDLYDLICQHEAKHVARLQISTRTFVGKPYEIALFCNDVVIAIMGYGRNKEFYDISLNDYVNGKHEYMKLNFIGCKIVNNVATIKHIDYTVTNYKLPGVIAHRSVFKKNETEWFDDSEGLVND